jgi:hypothetical protein
MAELNPVPTRKLAAILVSGRRQYHENSGPLKPGEETVINGLYDSGREYWFGSRFEFQPAPAMNVPWIVLRRGGFSVSRA